jgi:hypothetical protein
MSGTIHPVTEHHIQEDFSPPPHHCKNLRYHTLQIKCPFQHICVSCVLFHTFLKLKILGKKYTVQMESIYPHMKFWNNQHIIMHPNLWFFLNLFIFTLYCSSWRYSLETVLCVLRALKMRGDVYTRDHMWVRLNCPHNTTCNTVVPFSLHTHTHTHTQKHT